MAKRFVGREPVYKGKTLFQLCCNLRDFGEGRIVYRHLETKYKEKCFYRLTEVKPNLTDSVSLEFKIFIPLSKNTYPNVLSTSKEVSSHDVLSL